VSRIRFGSLWLRLAGQPIYVPTPVLDRAFWSQPHRALTTLNPGPSPTPLTGLDAQAIASRMVGLPSASIPPRVLAKGTYFALSGVPPPFKRLIYPMPEPGGLGVHVTLDLGGQLKFGPDIEWVDVVDYNVDPARADKFYSLVRAYYPHLPDGALVPAYAGVRPKVTAVSSHAGAPAGDFVIQGKSAHGVGGLVALYGMESPGLTSCLAIGDYVLQKLLGPTAGVATGASGGI
jgi:L-2-hydroxyglutarate oxidase LhgO